MAENSSRSVALDLHKRYLVVAAVNREQQTVLPPRRVSLVQFPDWAHRHLQPSDAVILEAGPSAWFIYDLVRPCVARVVVANPRHVKLIASSCVKTDKKDVLVLARLLAANLVPEVWVPPQHVRQLRALVHHRQRLVVQAAVTKNRLHALLYRHQVVPPSGDLFASAQRDWWRVLPLCGQEKLLAEQNLGLLGQLTVLLQATETELARLSVSEPWAEQSAFLVQLPGFGCLSAMTLLAAIGDIARFPAPKNLVGYAGLGARVHDSGQTHHHGGITKEGRRGLRAVLVEAAWNGVQSDPRWRGQFERLAARRGRQKAIVAIARKLLVVVWYVLTDRAADHGADEEAVARSLLTWSARHRLATWLGLSRPEFVRRELDRLGLGHHLAGFHYGGTFHRLPPSGLRLDLPANVPADSVPGLAETPA